jgi:hypothetical protein
LLLTLAWSLAMNVEANGIARAEKVPTGCYFSGQPIVDVELAQSSECFAAVTTVRGDDEPADELAARIARNLKLFRANTRMDFFFIALYWLVFVLFGWVIDNGRVKVGEAVQEATLMPIVPKLLATDFGMPISGHNSV